MSTESTDYLVVPNDVAEGTFMRFSQWLYSGNYVHPAAPVDRHSDSLRYSGNARLLVFYREMAFIGSELAWPRLWTSFLTEPYGVTTSICFPEPDTEPCTDYMEFLLTHVKVWLFANTWDIPVLKDVSLYKLKQALIGMDLFDAPLGGIVRL